MDNSPNRRSPFWYWVLWVVIISAIIAFQKARTHGWANLASPGHLIELFGSGLAGGAIVGLIFRGFRPNRRSKP